MTHIVQFYESEDALASLVSEYITGGLDNGDLVLVIATEEHRREFAKRIRAKRIDAGASRLNMLDAREMLSAFMVDSTPDLQRFEETVAGAIRERLHGGHKRLRVYGEMVDLLWKNGQTDAALRIEDLWNELGARYDFSLLCAYSLDRDAICARHDRVLHSDLRDLFENAPIAMHGVGPDGTILWANNAELTLLDYVRDDYVGRNVAEFHADQDVLGDILRRLTNNEQICDYPARLVAKDGSIKHVEITSNAHFENGTFLHTRCFTRDVTDRKRLEDANAFLLNAMTALDRTLDYETQLQQIPKIAVPWLADACSVDTSDSAASELAASERRIVVPMKCSDRSLGAITLSAVDRKPFDRTDVSIAVELANRMAIALDNARLFNLAQTANRTKDEFLATLSHELRTPLTAILGWSRMMLLGGFDPETTRTALETIERSARTQAALIDDLLDLSKIVTGKLTLEHELVDLPAVIHNAVQTTKLAADARNITVDVNGIDERAVVMGDATRLQQIIWNLLSNAIKFSEQGGAVSLHVEHARGDVRIVVRDQGKGISPEFLPHVFEAFRQADGASTRAHNGLGLGLAIVKYLVEHHGGSVSASSDGAGEGATFTVTLPLAAGRTARVHERPKVEVADLHGVSILLVDDDAGTRDVVSAMLRRCGADVDAASCVNDARSLLDAKLPNVLVTDIAMPEQDGFALLNYIRTRTTPQGDLRLVALTATAEPQAEERLREAGFDAYVRKPVDPMEFARTIAGLH